MESEEHVVWHNGRRRQASKRSSGTLQTLPDSCCARALSYLELREVELVGECSLNSKVRACSRELWLMLCEQQWPAVASSEALRKAVMMRHPRDYFIHKYLDCYSPRPLLDLDNHLVQHALACAVITAAGWLACRHLQDPLTCGLVCAALVALGKEVGDELELWQHVGPLHRPDGEAAQVVVPRPVPARRPSEKGGQ